MSEVKYEMKPVTKKREKQQPKRYRSIYDPIIDQFLESGEKLVEISIEDKILGSVVTQLKKRIGKRGLGDVEASHSGGFIYLEKKQE